MEDKKHLWIAFVEAEAMKLWYRQKEEELREYLSFSPDMQWFRDIQSQILKQE